MTNALPPELAAHIAEPELSFAPPGWHALLLRMHAQMAAIKADYALTQVKEKFGGLRVYLDEMQCSEEVREGLRRSTKYAVIQAAETCQECGGPGRQRMLRRASPEKSEIGLSMCGGVAVLCDRCEASLWTPVGS